MLLRDLQENLLGEGDSGRLLRGCEVGQPEQVKMAPTSEAINLLGTQD